MEKASCPTIDELSCPTSEFLTELKDGLKKRGCSSDISLHVTNEDKNEESSLYRAKLSLDQVVVKAPSVNDLCFWTKAFSLSGTKDLSLLKSFCPQVKWRCLWVLKEFDTEHLIKRAISLGMNSVCLQSEYAKEEVIKECQRWGLSTFVAVEQKTFSSEETLLFEELVIKLSDVADGIVVRVGAKFFGELASKQPEKTFYELHSLLVKKLASLLKTSLLKKGKLIYLIEAKDEKESSMQAAWMNRLQLDLPKNVYLAFHSQSGAPFEDYRQAHPLWQQFKAEPHGSLFHAMPVVNMGALQFGEGYWPAPPISLGDSVVSSVLQFNLPGMIAVVGSVPKEGGIVDMALWVAAFRIWFSLAKEDAARLWMSHYRKIEELPLLIEGRRIVENILRATSLDVDAEGLKNIMQAQISSLTQMEVLADSMEKTKVGDKVGDNNVFLCDLLPYFCRDMCRIAAKMLQERGVSLPVSIDLEESKPSFWTECAMGQKITVFSSAAKESKDPKMLKIIGSI